MNNNTYVKLSLELHLFFDRIMKEHSFFLEAAFMEKDYELKRIANNFQKVFSNILDKIIPLANNNISKEALSAGEFITTDTLQAESKTSILSGINIDTNLTVQESNLQIGKPEATSELVTTIRALNRETLVAVQNLIKFKNDILTNVLNCNLYTTNYPLLIMHILNEAKMYYNLLTKIENKEILTEADIYDQEMFWNNIMKEHAEFIRGLLDPSERKLILTADKYASEYATIAKNYSSNLNTLTDFSLKETINFRDFKVAGEKGILNCQVKSIIIPLLADHVVREANHFLRLLNTYKNN